MNNEVKFNPKEHVPVPAVENALPVSEKSEGQKLETGKLTQETDQEEKEITKRVVKVYLRGQFVGRDNKLIAVIEGSNLEDVLMEIQNKRPQTEVVTMFDGHSVANTGKSVLEVYADEIELTTLEDFSKKFLQ